jgi:hypothetical protein
MHSFSVPAHTELGLTFFDRLPDDPEAALSSFKVRITDVGLSAELEVWAGYHSPTPTPLFEAMAAQWAGWAGELEWSSLERECLIRCTHDRFGHVGVTVTLVKGIVPEQWRVTGTVYTEAGQLEHLANAAKQFFGRIDPADG